MDMLDKNGRKLKGGAVWLKTIANEGGLDKYNKKIAIEYFTDFVEKNPRMATAITQVRDDERRKERLSIVK